MAKYRKKPIVIEAELWQSNGDHSEDGGTEVGTCPDWDKTEGAVVRRFRDPQRPGHIGHMTCQFCGMGMVIHGWIDTLEGGHIVCPSDWIITVVQGERYPCKPGIFEQTYEEW